MRKKLSLTSVLLIISMGIGGYYLFNPHAWFFKKDQGQNKRVSQVLQYQYSINCQHRLPQGIAVFSGRLYVSYRGFNKIDILDYKGKYLDSFSPFPGGTVNLLTLASDAKGNIYVVDEKNRILLVFDQKNNFLYPFPPRRMNPSDADFLCLPIGVSIHRHLIFITDMGSNSVKAFLNNGDFLMAIKGLGENGEKPWHPRGVALCQDGRILVSDVMEKKVAVFNCAGKFAYFFENTEGKDELTAPGAMAIDGKGRVHVVDTMMHRVFVYDNYGKFLFTYGLTGRKEGQLSRPRGIAIDNIKNLIFIADSRNKQIDVWGY